jgi:hypothetical protein
LVKEYDDKRMMNTANEFLIFSATRNELIVSELGIMGYYEDCTTITKEQIWGWFKDYLTEKVSK